jgi:hypothetical protein
VLLFHQKAVGVARMDEGKIGSARYSGRRWESAQKRSGRDETEIIIIFLGVAGSITGVCLTGWFFTNTKNYELSGSADKR